MEKDKYITIPKKFLNIKVIYQLIITAIEYEDAFEIEKLFDVLKKENLKNINIKANATLIDALVVYNLKSTEINTHKARFISISLDKFNSERLEGLEEKIYTDLLKNENLLADLNEDLIIQILTSATFKGNKIIAKDIVNDIISKKIYIEKEANRHYLMLCGLYLGIEEVRSLSYMVKEYIKIMDSEIDNEFVNFLMGNIEFDKDYYKVNKQRFKVLNKNLVEYIYKFVPEEMKSQRVSKNIRRNRETKSLDVLYINKYDKICDVDKTDLRYKMEKINVYDYYRVKKIGELNEHILYCPNCQRKSVSIEILRKLYKRIDSKSKLKFSNLVQVNKVPPLNMLGYNTGITRSDRLANLREIILPTLGVEKTLEYINYFIKTQENKKGMEFSRPLMEWKHDIKFISENYK